MTSGRAGEKNGVRLVLGDGPRGRLELSSTEGWLTDYVDGAVAWLPVCQMIGFDDSKAQVERSGLDGKVLYAQANAVERKATKDARIDCYGVNLCPTALEWARGSCRKAAKQSRQWGQGRQHASGRAGLDGGMCECL